jgi:hypothetical protein
LTALSAAIHLLKRDNIEAAAHLVECIEEFTEGHESLAIVDRRPAIAIELKHAAGFMFLWAGVAWHQDCPATTAAEVEREHPLCTRIRVTHA